MPKSRLTLELSDNEPLVEVMEGREPGERLCFKVWGRLLDNTSQQANIAVDEVEHIASEGEGAKTDDEQADYGDDDSPIGAVVDKAMSKS